MGCSSLQLLTTRQINLKIDPEGAKVALTADFPTVTIVGNAANQVFPDQEYLDEVYEVKNGYTELFYNYYGTSVRLTPSLMRTQDFGLFLTTLTFPRSSLSGTKQHCSQSWTLATCSTRPAVSSE